MICPNVPIQFIFTIVFNIYYPDPLHPGAGEFLKGIPEKLGQADSENL